MSLVKFKTCAEELTINFGEILRNGGKWTVSCGNTDEYITAFFGSISDKYSSGDYIA